MNDLEWYENELIRLKRLYKENIKEGIRLQQELKDVEIKVERLNKCLKQGLPVGTELIFKDIDSGQEIKVVIIEPDGERKTFMLLNDTWTNQNLSKWYVFNYKCRYSDTLINEFCDDYEVEFIGLN